MHITNEFELITRFTGCYRPGIVNMELAAERDDPTDGMTECMGLYAFWRPKLEYLILFKKTRNCKITLTNAVL